MTTTTYRTPVQEIHGGLVAFLDIDEAAPAVAAGDERPIASALTACEYTRFMQLRAASQVIEDIQRNMLARLESNL